MFQINSNNAHRLGKINHHRSNCLDLQQVQIFFCLVVTVTGHPVLIPASIFQQAGCLCSQQCCSLDTSGRSDALLYVRSHSPNAGRSFLLPQRWRVIGNDDQLGLALTKRLQCLAVPKHKLATLHHQSQARVNALNCLFL